MIYYRKASSAAARPYTRSHLRYLPPLRVKLAQEIFSVAERKVVQVASDRCRQRCFECWYDQASLLSQIPLLPQFHFGDTGNERPRSSNRHQTFGDSWWCSPPPGHRAWTRLNSPGSESKSQLFCSCAIAGLIFASDSGLLA